MEKLNKANKNNKKEYSKKVKIAVQGIKQLGKPLTGKFLSLVIKNEIVNSKHREEEGIE